MSSFQRESCMSLTVLLFLPLPSPPSCAGNVSTLKPRPGKWPAHIHGIRQHLSRGFHRTTEPNPTFLPKGSQTSISLGSAVYYIPSLDIPNAHSHIKAPHQSYRKKTPLLLFNPAFSSFFGPRSLSPRDNNTKNVAWENMDKVLIY